MAGGESYTIVPNSLIESRTLTGSEKLILLSLLRHTNSETKRAWPSQETIANEAGLKRRRVIDTLKGLEEKGIVKTEKKLGHVTLYEVVTSAINAHVQEMHQCKNCTPHVQPLHIPCANTAHPPVQNLHTINTNKQVLKKNTNDNHYETDFEQFWQAYPKPQYPDKSPGQKRYIALRKKGVSAEDLLKAAQGYAAAMRGTQPRYIKHCATFLGPQEPWKDYVDVPEQKTSDGLPDAELLFPKMAAWIRKNGGKI